MQYVSSSVRTISLIFLGMTVALLGITAIEKFAFLLQLALEYSIDLRSFLLLYATTLPDFVDLMLPVAVLVATYIVVLAKREGREFLILSSAGAGRRPLFLMALGTGLTAVTVSILISGFVKPASTYAFRRHYQEIISAGVSEGALGSRFYRKDGNVMLVAPAGDGSGNRVRVFAFEADRLNRLTVSNCADLRVVEGEVLAQLCGADIYLFGETRGIAAFSNRTAEAGCRLCPTADGKLDLARLRVDESTLLIEMGRIFKSIDTQRPKDLDLVSLLATSDGRFDSSDGASMAAGYVLLAESCLLAVALALTAVSITTFRTRAFALAGAIGAMMGFIVMIRSGFLLVGPVENPGHFLAVVIAGAAVSVGAVAAAVTVLHGSLVRPRMARA